MQQTMRASHIKTYDENGRIGQVIDSYKLVRRLGCGSNGAVYEAMHVNLGRRYALKILHPHLVGNLQAVARFVAEGQAANRPAIAGVVAVHDVKRTKDGQIYILMEYLDGETLAARIARAFPRGENLTPGGGAPSLRPVPHSTYVNTSLMLARQIASTLELIHSSGVVHRDLKPENLFVTNDPDSICGERIKILDFGIAKVVDPSTQTHNGPPTWAPTMQPTAVGTVLGTPTYMPPEQWYGSSQADARSDVYSCGAIFYEMMCGRPPFTAAFIGELMEQHVHLQPTPLEEAAPWAPASFAGLVKEMLSKLPASRPTMTEVVARLQMIIREHKLQRSVSQVSTLDDVDVTIRRYKSSSSLPEIVPRLTKTPIRWKSMGIGVAIVVVSVLLKTVPSVLSPPDSPPSVKEIQRQITSFPSGAKVYLFETDSQGQSDSLQGLLEPHCATPCQIPESELRKPNIQLIISKDLFRSRRLKASDIERGFVKEPVLLQPRPVEPARRPPQTRGAGRR